MILTKLLSLVSSNRERVLIFDDSLYSRARSKTVELLARVHDHTTGQLVKGFRMLTIGWPVPTIKIAGYRRSIQTLTSEPLTTSDVGGSEKVN